MIEETGKVVAVEGEYVWVETIRQTACNSCELKSGCGQQLLSKAFGDQRTHLKLKNDLSLQANDCVVLGIPEEALLKGSLLVYMLPLLLMFCGAVLFETLSGANELTTIVGALSGLLAGFMLIRWQSMQDNYTQMPLILRMVKTNIQPAV